MSDIFLSYSRADGPAAALIVDALKGRGWSVWWDQNLEGGTHFDHEIPKELDAAKCVVVLWSTESAVSDWVVAEADQARRQKKLIPVLIDDVTLPLQFQRIQAVRLVEVREALTTPDFGELLDAVAQKLGEPVQERSVKPRRRLTPRGKILIAGGIALALLVAFISWLGFRTPPPKHSTLKVIDLDDHPIPGVVLSFGASGKTSATTSAGTTDLPLPPGGPVAAKIESPDGWVWIDPPDRQIPSVGAGGTATVRLAQRGDPGILADKNGALDALSRALGDEVHRRKESSGGDLSDDELRGARESVAREFGLPLADIDLALDRSEKPLDQGHAARSRGDCPAAARYYARALDEKVRLLENLDDSLPKIERSDRRARAAEVAIWLADAYSCTGQYEEALTVVRKVLKEDPDNPQLLNELGRTYLPVAQFSEASRQFERAIQELGKTRKETDPLLLAVSMNLAQARFGEGKLQEAAEVAERTVAREEKALGADHPDTLAGLQVLGNLRFELGDYTGAKEIQERLLATSIQISGPEDDQSMFAEHDLARTLGKLGDNRAALGHFQHVIEVWGRARGIEHPEVFIVRTGLAQTLLALGRLDDAKREAVHAVHGLTRSRGGSDPETLVARGLVADIERKLGNYQVALGQYLAILETRRKTLPKDDSQITISEMNYSQALFETGDLDGARALQERSVEKTKRQLGPDHDYALWARVNLAITLTQLAEPARAARLLEDVAAKRTKTLGIDNPLTIGTRQRLAAALRAEGKPAQARKLDQVVISSPLGVDHPTVLAARADLALILRDEGNLAGAEKQQDEVLARWTHARGAEHPVTLQVRFQRAETLAAQGDLATARTELEAVASLQAKKLDPHHPDTVATEWALVGVLDRLKEEAGAAELRRNLRWLLAEPPAGLSAVEGKIVAALKAAGEASYLPSRNEVDLCATMRRFAPFATHPLEC
jgi:tetratricopeptide (TPR) repeat protein